VTIVPLANDSDPDGDPLTVTVPVQPPNGTVTVNPDGSVVYTPNDGFTGTETITYVVDDGNGGTATAEITVEVSPDPQGLVPTDLPGGDVAIETPEDTPVTGQLVAVDPEGGDVTFSGPAAGPANGSVTVNPDGSYEYTPSPDYHGPDQFTVTVTDEGGATTEIVVNVTVTPVQDAFDDEAETEQGVSVDIPVSGNDTFGGSATITGIDAPSGATVVPDGMGGLTYTPPTGFQGIDEVVLTWTDDHGNTETSVVRVNVLAVPVPIDGPKPPLPPSGGVPVEPISVDGAVLAAVEGLRPLGNVTGIAADGIVISAANGVDSLGGLGNAGSVGEAVASERITDARIWQIGEALSRSGFGPSDAWKPDNLSGFSLRYSDSANGLGAIRGLDVVIESLVRKGIVIIQVENPVSADDGRKVTGVRFQSPGGGALPAWLDQAGPRVLMGERPADLETFDLGIIVEFDDGTSETRAFRIQGESGEIQNLPERRSEMRAPLFMEQFNPTYALTEGQIEELGRLLKS
ncbi:MAG: cadherin-like domain-containing protein, partial [Pseudomonadota bacterium]